MALAAVAADWLPCAACRRRADPARAASGEMRALGDDHFKKEEWADAISAYSKAISQQPKEASLWLRRAAVYERLGDWQQALRDSGRAVQLDERSEPCALAKIQALQRLDKADDARAECERALQLNAKSRELLRLREQLAPASAAGESGGASSSSGAKAKAGDSSAASGGGGGGEKAPLAGADAATAPSSSSSAAASAAKAKVKAKAKPAAKSSSIDYSKWANLEDSDDSDAGGGGGGGGKGSKSKAAAEPKPSQMERLNLVEEMLEVARNAASEASSHFGEAPASVTAKSLPPSHNSPVGIMSVEQLRKFTCSNDRMLVSIYGDIYDVSSRPDLFGYGPKSTQAGHDITWAVVIGKETKEHLDRFYDIFKLDEDRLGRYLQIICQRMVHFESEFGQAVGRLQPFVEEWLLPEPPTDEIEECKQQ